MNVLYPVIAFLVGFVLVYVSVPTIINVAKSKRLFDEPNERTASRERVPTLGGVAIFIGLLISTIIGTFNFAFVEFKYLTVAVILMFFIGLKDDIQVISAKKKIICSDSGSSNSCSSWRFSFYQLARFLLGT